MKNEDGEEVERRGMDDDSLIKLMVYYLTTLVKFVYCYFLICEWIDLQERERDKSTYCHYILVSYLKELGIRICLRLAILYFLI